MNEPNNKPTPQSPQDTTQPKRRFFNNRFKKDHRQKEPHNREPQSYQKSNSQGEQPKRQWPNRNRQENQSGAREVQGASERGNLAFHKDLKKGVETNTRIQKNSLNPHNKLNLNTKASVRITPLGGLGEIGGNMMVMETEKSAIIIDVGMSFPEENMHGVDILIPDFTYLHSIKDKIAGVIITHAHEDHIGAVPYLFKELQFPLYGTPLALGMIGAKFDEHGLKKFRPMLKVIQKREPVQIGDFEIEWIHITHSSSTLPRLRLKQKRVLFSTQEILKSITRLLIISPQIYTA